MIEKYCIKYTCILYTISQLLAIVVYCSVRRAFLVGNGSTGVPIQMQAKAIGVHAMHAARRTKRKVPLLSGGEGRALHCATWLKEPGQDTYAAIDRVSRRAATARAARARGF